MTPYLAHALLPAGSDLTDVMARIAVQAGGMLAASGPIRAAEVRFGSYPFFIAIDDGSLPESEFGATRAHMLEIVGTEAERQREYVAVVTVSGRKPDPDMDHFNDSLLLLETIEVLFPGAILFDPQSGNRI
ncbi:hypothetical protein [Deinococcus knuensis]|uniref:Uncharacterized protein n=1 Tax=Deinococcus knuensis TaxID=1837380 RepID=A0ABQ2SA76_9DEIO|nr:hypothetical protein [Deinococcus knuensis]GGS13947.1 hypothetical protein GCM10008961_01450 [Deinococcus knuensis]